MSTLEEKETLWVKYEESQSGLWLYYSEIVSKYRKQGAVRNSYTICVYSYATMITVQEQPRQ
jgi:hypothetical protein